MKRVKYIQVNLTEQEYLVVQENSKKAGLKFSSYIREMTLRGSVDPRLNDDERHLFRELVAMSNDVHQLVKMAREQGVPAMMASFETCRGRIDEALNRNKL